ncbi:kinetochore-associated Ndc80 complex subunit spc25 [Dimargaris xerosporica]|nr:kinetochore-associated Ndc80 complex subunit spc25 [Dimargaris xerosporica]
MAMTPLYSRQKIRSPDMDEAVAGLDAASHFGGVEISNPAFPYDDIKESIASFTKQFDQYVATKRQAINDQRLAWQKTRAENKGKKKQDITPMARALFARIFLAANSALTCLSLESKIETYANKHEELVKNRQKETSEIEAIRDALSQLNIQRDDMERNRALLTAQVEALEREIAHKKEAIATKEKTLLRQQTRNEPELRFFEEKLALTVFSLRADLLEFTFTHISEKNWHQPFRFVVDVSSKEYKVPTCEPTLNQLPDLVAWLNRTRDFYQFLKKMRQGFVAQAKQGV